MAVQVDPIKPTLKAPGTQRLTLKCNELLSNFAFKCKLRRYMMERVDVHSPTTAAHLFQTLHHGRASMGILILQRPIPDSGGFGRGSDSDGFGRIPGPQI
jgi:hypothetical protein